MMQGKRLRGYSTRTAELASRLRRFIPGRRRIAGTSNSPQSKELLMDSHVDDFNGEVFDSGYDPYALQWDDIKRDYNLNRRENDEVFEDVDTDEHADEEPNDGKVVKTLKTSPLGCLMDISRN